MNEELEFCYFCQGYKCDCEEGVTIEEKVECEKFSVKESDTCYEMYRIREDDGDISIGMEDGELKTIFFKGVAWGLDSMGEWTLESE